MEKKKRIVLTVTAALCAAILAAVIAPLSVFYASKVYPEDLISVPVIRLDKKYRTTVDKANYYMAHPDIVMTESGDLLTFYVKGHGKGEILTKRSVDLGETWSERLTDTPESWKNSQETPTAYRITKTDGTSLLFLFSGKPYWSPTDQYPADGFNWSYSTDDGASWSEFRVEYGIEWARERGKEPFDCIVAMSSLTQIRENGAPVDRWLATFHDHAYRNYKTYLTFDAAGNPQFSEPERLLETHAAEEARLGICEVEVIRNPDRPDTLIMLARTNTHVENSAILFSYDEGSTWSAPKILPNELSGERHKAEYDETTGKLLISFRQLIPGVRPDAFSKSSFYGEYWAAWVGTFADLMTYADADASNDAKGEAYLLLGRNTNGTADTGYSGSVCKDGVFVLDSYGYFSYGSFQPYIMSVKFRLSDLGL